MLYIVIYDRELRIDHTNTPKLCWAGNDKQTAVNAFKNAFSTIDTYGGVSSTVPRHKVYLAGFNSNEHPGSKWVSLTAEQYTAEVLNDILSNLTSADFLYSFTNHGSKLKPTACDHCGKSTTDLTTTAYGRSICDECFNEYLLYRDSFGDSSPGGGASYVEYLIRIAKGSYKINAFTAGELTLMIGVWNSAILKKKLALPVAELNSIYNAAVAVGFNDIVDQDGEPVTDLLDPKNYYK